MRSRATTVSEYLAKVSPDRRPALRKLRAMIRKSVPRAKESMLYGMPTYELGGEMLCAFAAQSSYLAFYLCDTDLVARFRSKLGTTDCGKSCIRYRKPEAMPLAVLERMLRIALKNRGTGSRSEGKRSKGR